MVRNIPQCIAPMGTLLGDKYVAIGGAKPQITFWSETAQKLTHVASPLGPVTCLAVQLDTGESEQMIISLVFILH